MRNMVIVGASSGIGRALAQRLIEEGNQVYGTFAHRTTNDLEGLAGFHHLDVLQENPDFSFLPDTIDGLVYCPGAITLKPFLRLRTEDFAADYQLQVLSRQDHTSQPAENEKFSRRLDRRVFHGGRANRLPLPLHGGGFQGRPGRIDPRIGGRTGAQNPCELHRPLRYRYAAGRSLS